MSQGEEPSSCRIQSVKKSNKHKINCLKAHAAPAYCLGPKVSMYVLVQSTAVDAGIMSARSCPRNSPCCHGRAGSKWAALPLQCH